MFLPMRSRAKSIFSANARESGSEVSSPAQPVLPKAAEAERRVVMRAFRSAKPASTCWIVSCLASLLSSLLAFHCLEDLPHDR